MRVIAIAVLCLSACAARVHESAPAAIADHAPQAAVAPTRTHCRPERTLRLYGCVYSTSDGKPVVGATVVVSTPQGAIDAVITDESGAYAIQVYGEIAGFDVYYDTQTVHVDEHVDASELHHRVQDVAVAPASGEVIQTHNEIRATRTTSADRRLRVRGGVRASQAAAGPGGESRVGGDHAGVRRSARLRGRPLPRAPLRLRLRCADPRAGAGRDRRGARARRDAGRRLITDEGGAYAFDTTQDTVGLDVYYGASTVHLDAPVPADGQRHQLRDVSIDSATGGEVIELED